MAAAIPSQHRRPGEGRDPGPQPPGLRCRPTWPAWIPAFAGMTIENSQVARVSEAHPGTRSHPGCASLTRATLLTLQSLSLARQSFPLARQSWGRAFQSSSLALQFRSLALQPFRLERRVLELARRARELARRQPHSSRYGL